MFLMLNSCLIRQMRGINSSQETYLRQNNVTEAQNTLTSIALVPFDLPLVPLNFRAFFSM